MEIFLLILRLALAAIFGIAGIAKLFDPAGSEKAFGDFGLPKAIAQPMVYILPLFELAIAAAMIFVQSSWFGAIGASGLFLIFTAGMSYQMAKGNAPDCHCFGQIHSEPVGVSSIVRNVLMLIPAVFLVIQGRAAQGTDLITDKQAALMLVIGVVIMVLLLAGVLFLKTISEQQNQIIRRIEIMELVGREGGSVEREEIGHPREGLPIGSLVPDFTLPDIDGNIVTLEQLKADAQPVVFIFVSPTCNPCRALLPKFDEWVKEFAGEIKFVFISNGDVEDNLAKFGSKVSKLILLQKSDEVAHLFRAKWTPMAVLMNTNGRIASFTGPGDIGIRDLVGQLEKTDTVTEYTYFTDEGFVVQVPIKIGESVPDLSMLALDGNRLGLADFKGKPTLVAFWSPTCHHCVEMMDELKEWDAVKGPDDPNLIVFSDGGAHDHKALGLKSPIILDKSFNTATHFGVFGSPSAIMVDENARFISETAIGAEDIWALVGKQK